MRRADADADRSLPVPPVPMTQEEIGAFVMMAGKGAGDGQGFYDGMQLAMAAMLVSPQFLYIIESAEPDPAAPGSLRLDNHARAARLSYLLWNTTPNEALLRA
ncbi:DUF1595 domain-containing protein [Sphingobium scionense]